MKRTLTLALACAMLFTLSIGAIAADSVSYRVTEIYDIGYLLDEDESYVDFNSPLDNSLPYGETVYYPLLSDEVDTGEGYVGVYESAATKNIKIKTDWEEGSSFISQLSVVRKRFIGSINNVNFNSSKYVYFLAIKTKARSTTTTATNDVYGTIKLRKSGDYGFDYDEMPLTVNFEVGYNPPEDSNVIPIKPALFEPDVDFDEYEDETFDFEADSRSFFVVNTNNQKKIVLGMNTDYDENIGDRFPNAYLDFYNGNGASFNRVGYLYLYAPDNGYVYQIQDNGKLEKVTTSYDAYEDSLVVRTRTLGRYVVSDRKLDVAENTKTDDEDPSVIYDNDTQTNHNPGTGGYGFDDIAYGLTLYASVPVPAVPEASTPSAAAATTGQSSSAAALKQEKASEQKRESTVIGTTQQTKSKTVMPTTDTQSVPDNIVASLTMRALMMLICAGGAIISAIGLLVCALINFSRSRKFYY